MIWMTARRLDWELRAQGTDLAQWPDAQRRAALRLLRRSRAARDLLADALANEPPPAPDAPALQRMQRGLRQRLAPPPAVVRGMGWGALAACAAAGLYLGTGAAQLDPTPDPLVPEQASLFAALDP